MFASISSYAQTSHLQFMGIPLDGNITAFEQKLLAKGVKPDKEYNSNSDPGEKKYNGKFSGQDAEIWVFFDYKTKTVYHAEAIIEMDTKESAINLFEKFEKTITEKYADWTLAKEEEEDLPYYSWQKENYGVIKMNLYKEYQYLGYTQVILRYIDNVNREKHINSQLLDL